MNTPAFRIAGTSSQFATQLQQAGAYLSRASLARPTLALLGGGVAVTAAVAGFLVVTTSPPDPVRTAAVPPRVTLPQTASTAAKPAIPQADITAPKQARAADTPAPQRTPLGADSSRWVPAQPSSSNPGNVATQGPDERQAQASSSAPAVYETPDSTDTGSIAPDGLRGTLDVQVAETEAEIAMLEASTGMVGESASDANGPLPDLRPAKAAKYANLRDGPADEAKVIVVVPANAAIEAETDCNWCTVVYQGQRGYIYKNLIRRTVAEEAKAGQGLF